MAALRLRALRSWMSSRISSERASWRGWEGGRAAVGLDVREVWVWEELFWCTCPGGRSCWAGEPNGDGGECLCAGDFGESPTRLVASVAINGEDSVSMSVSLCRDLRVRLALRAPLSFRAGYFSSMAVSSLSAESIRWIYLSILSLGIP